MGTIHSIIYFLFIVIGLSSSLLPYFLSHKAHLEVDDRALIDDPVINESFFHKIKYFSRHGGKKRLHLNADDLTVNRMNSQTLFLNPAGTSMTTSGKEVHYKADRGEYVTDKEYLKLEGSVSLESKDSKLGADKVYFYGEKDEVLCRGNVKTESFSEKTRDRIIVESNYVKWDVVNNRSHFEGKVRGEVKRRRAYEQNVSFASRKMQLDMNENKAYLQDDVFLKKRSVKAYSRSGEIYLENYNKRLKYFVLFDDVRVVEKVKLPGVSSGKSFERKAFSEKLEGIMSEGKIILSGYPKVLQQGDTIKGNLIILREDVDVIEVVDANTNFKVSD